MKRRGPLSSRTRSKISLALKALNRKKGRGKKDVAVGLAGAGVAAVGIAGGAAYLKSKAKKTENNPLSNPPSGTAPVVPDPWADATAMEKAKTNPMGVAQNKRVNMPRPDLGARVNSRGVAKQMAKNSSSKLATTTSTGLTDAQAIMQKPVLGVPVLAIVKGRQARREVTRQVEGFKNEMAAPIVRQGKNNLPVDPTIGAAARVGKTMGAGAREGMKAVRNPGQKVREDISATSKALKRLLAKKNRK